MWYSYTRLLALVTVCASVRCIVEHDSCHWCYRLPVFTPLFIQFNFHYLIQAPEWSEFLTDVGFLWDKAAVSRGTIKWTFSFKVYGSVHRKYIPIYIQQDATLHSLFISGNCSTCFGWYLHPSSGAHTTVSTASGICHTITATCFYRGRTLPR